MELSVADASGSVPGRIQVVRNGCARSEIREHPWAENMKACSLSPGGRQCPPAMAPTHLAPRVKRVSALVANWISRIGQCIESDKGVRRDALFAPR